MSSVYPRGLKPPEAIVNSASIDSCNAAAKMSAIEIVKVASVLVLDPAFGGTAHTTGLFGTPARLASVMFCPECGHDLGGVDAGAPCPVCGSDRRSAVVSPSTVEVKVSIPEPTLVAESNHDDGTRETVVGGPDGRFTSVSLDDEYTQDFVGVPARGEDNVPAALHRLRDTLNDRAGSRIWIEQVGHEHPAVDGTLLATDGRIIECQVTRVERSTLPDRGRVGAATSHKGPAELAANIMEAIESKLSSADGAMFLVLDANDAPAFTDDRHVAALAQAEIEHDGYIGRWREIWLIGPTVSRTSRIDTTQQEP